MSGRHIDYGPGFTHFEGDRCTRRSVFVCWAAMDRSPEVRLIEADNPEEAERIHRELVPGDYELELFEDDAAGLRNLGEGLLNDLEALGPADGRTVLSIVLKEAP